MNYIMNLLHGNFIILNIGHVITIYLENLFLILIIINHNFCRLIFDISNHIILIHLDKFHGIMRVYNTVLTNLN